MLSEGQKRQELTTICKRSDSLGWCEWPKEWSDITCRTCCRFYDIGSRYPQASSHKTDINKFKAHIKTQKKNIDEIKLHRSIVQFEAIRFKRIKEEQDRKYKAFKESIINGKGYCYYHRSHYCRCSRDRDGIYMGDSYPYIKYCSKQNSIKCVCCARHPDGEMVVKLIKKSIDGKPLKFCERHRTWHCKCQRDIRGTIMSVLDRYPIEKYCCIHRDIECKCKRDDTGKVVEYIEK